MFAGKLADSGMFNVCLVQPPIEDFYATSIRNIPLGLLSIGTSLRSKHKVRLMDLRFGRTQTITTSHELSAVSPYYRPTDASPFSLYKHYARYGLSDTEIKNLIPKDTDIFLVSTLFSTYIFEAISVIKIIREQCQNAIIIAGGSGAVFHPQEFFQTGTDFIFRGEGETACRQLLDELEKTEPDFSSIPNLIWRKDNTIFQNPASTITYIDSLPFPDYTIPGTPVYRLADKKHAMLMASRGCPHHCEFCSIHQIFGTKYRLRSVENVIQEIKQKVDQGFRSFDFEDDHFGGNQRWLNELLGGIIKDFAEYNLSFQAMNGITANNLDEQILKKMKQVGFYGINLSLVTPDQTRQDALKRPFNTKQFSDIVYMAGEIGLDVTAYLIIGLPGDSVEENLNSILSLADLPVLIGPSLFYLVPGTPLFNQLKNTNSIPDSPRCFRSSYFPYDRPDFSRTSAMTLFRICRIINFLKAAQKYQYQPSEYKIINERIVIPDSVSGKQSQITLGFALLELLINSGKIFGTGKKQRDYYPVIVENCDTLIVKKFISTYHWNE